jgi:hypothetical protein
MACPNLGSLCPGMYPHALSKGSKKRIIVATYPHSPSIVHCRLKAPILYPAKVSSRVIWCIITKNLISCLPEGILKHHRKDHLYMLYETICLARKIVFCMVSSCFSKHYLRDFKALSKRYFRFTHGPSELRIPFLGMYPQYLSRGSNIAIIRERYPQASVFLRYWYHLYQKVFSSIIERIKSTC